MKITITIAPLLLSLFLTSIVQPLRGLRIVQYNVEWLFIDYNAAADCPGNGCSWKNKTDAEIHLDTVSKNLAEIDPDIVNFCEVQGLDELNQVSQNLNNGIKPYFVKGKDTSTGQNVGLLSKIMPNIAPYRTDARATYPIPGSKCGYQSPPDSPTADTGVSKHSISEFILPELGQTALITAHLLAFPTDPLRCAEREAQATVLHKVIADYLAKGYEVIVMGDFNDYDGTILDSNGDRPISQVLDILKINGSLTNIAEKIPQTSRFTEWYDANKNCVSTPNEFSMIDHILVSSKIFAHLKNAHIYQNYGEYCGTYQSDHYPVVLDLDLEPVFCIEFVRCVKQKYRNMIIMENIYETDASFPFDKLILLSPTALSGGNYFIKYQINKMPLYIQPPKCKTRNGIHMGGTTTNIGSTPLKMNKRMHCDLMFSNEDESLIRWMEDLETHTCRQLYENREK